MRMQWTLVLLALPLAACGGDTSEPASEEAAPTSETSETPIAAADDAAPTNAQPAGLVQCRTCHTFDEGGANQLGPNLWNTHGNPAAANAEFAYSSALRESGIIWDDAALDAYLENPRKKVPGGKMSFVGLRKTEDRKAVIDYLATLKPES